MTITIIIQPDEAIMSKLSDLAGALNGVETLLVKVATDVQTLISSLQNVDLPADADAALEQVETTVQAILDTLEPPA